MALALILLVVAAFVVAGVKMPNQSKENNVQKMTRPQFHFLFAERAQMVDWKGIPWRFALAVADLETGNGNNGLTREANNLFSIKVGSGWTTAGWKGGRTYTTKDGGVFRAYNSWTESMKDFIHLLEFGIYSKARVAALTGDFKAFARELKAAGYDASMPSYAQALEKLYEGVVV